MGGKIYLAIYSVSLQKLKPCETKPYVCIVFSIQSNHMLSIKNVSFSQGIKNNIR